MRLYCDVWDGPIKAILADRKAAFQYGIEVDPEDLPYELEVVDDLAEISEPHVTGFDMVYLGGDNFQLLGLEPICRKLGAKIVYTIEYTPKTRQDIVWLDKNRNFPRKVYGTLWLAYQEMRRRKAFRDADALQANGLPSYEHYKPIAKDTLLFFDSRATQDTIATQAEMDARAARLAAGKPLRLMFSGRLEPMKGAQDLLPIAHDLRKNGVAFQLDIFGAGSMVDEVSEGIGAQGLSDFVTYHGAVDYKTKLVPFARQNSDLFISCNRQGDPSATYIESLGFGLPIVGYRNENWKILCNESKGGWSVPMGDWTEIAATITRLDKDRTEVSQKSENGWNFTRAHAFEEQFSARMKHLRDITLG
jgi:glycosyltransferase involved in cell wall biosynthesis